MIHSPVLVLNRHYLPVHITSAKRAFSLLYRGAARAINESFEAFDFHAWRSIPDNDGFPCIRLVCGPIRVPRVILLTSFDRQPPRRERFSRIRVMARDRHTCQYCGTRLSRRELNMDHVIPRRYGGDTSWENVVCCCLRCNRKKGGRTPEEAGMRLVRLPKAPAAHTFWAHLMPPGELFQEWIPFLAMRDKSQGQGENA